MDVLEYWRPRIVWSQFKRGPVSSKMWTAFKEMVQLCHAFRHWEDSADKLRMAPPQQWASPPENARQFKKRQKKWRQEIRGLEGHMNRAGFLANEKVAEMSYLIGPGGEGSPDGKLWFALRVTLNCPPQPCCKAAAFEAFDANRELEAEPAQIVMRWRRQAGYSP
jgi:hypothetical protein